MKKFLKVSLVLALALSSLLSIDILTVSANNNRQWAAWSGGDFGWDPVVLNNGTQVGAVVLGTISGNRELQMQIDFFAANGSHGGAIGYTWHSGVGQVRTSGGIRSGETANAIHRGRGPSTISRTTSVRRP